MEHKQAIGTSGKQPILRRLLRWAGWLLGIVLCLLLTLALLLQLPAVQKAAVSGVSSWLSQKTNSTVQVQGVKIAFPYAIALKGLYATDIKGDTLVAAGAVFTDLDMLALLRGNVLIEGVTLDNARVFLKRDAAGNFNYAHWLQAFASGNKAAPAHDSTQVQFLLRKAGLNNVSLHYYDEVSGIDGIFYLQQLRAKTEKIDPEKLQFQFKSFDWNGGTAHIKMWRPSAKAMQDTLQSSTEDLQGLPDFLFTRAQLSEIDFSYQYPNDGMDMTATVGSFDTKNLRILLNEQLIHLGDAEIRNSRFRYNASGGLPDADELPDTAARQWVVRSGEMALHRCQFAYHDTESKPVKKGMDYGNLDFSGINLTGKNLYVYGADTVSLSLMSGTLQEKSGLQVTGVKGNLLYTANGVRLDDFLLTTPQSTLGPFAEIRYASPAHVAEHPEDLWMDLQLKNTVLSHKDLLTVAPVLYDYPMFADLPRAKMLVSGNIKGKLNDLTLRDVRFRGFGSTTVKASGKLKGLPDPDALDAALTVQEFTTTEADLRKLIPEGVIPERITLPATISGSGIIRGSITDLLTMDVSLRTSSGNGAIKGFVRNATDSRKASYNLSGRLNGFDAGHFLQMEDLGKTTLSFEAAGKGYAPEIITGKYRTTIDSIEYGGFTYRTLTAIAEADEGMVLLRSFSPEGLHDFDLDMQANFRNTWPVVTGRLNLKMLDLQALGFSASPLWFQGHVDANVPRLDPDHPEASLTFSNIQGQFDTLHFQLDTLVADANFYRGQQSLSLKTGFGKADMKGEFSVAAIFPELLNFVNLYYVIGKPVPALRGDQQANITLSVNPSPQLYQLVPGLALQRPLQAQLSFDSRDCIFDLKGTLPFLRYGNQSIKGGSFFANANDTTLAYKIFVDDYLSDLYAVPTLLLQGDIVQHKLFADIRLLDNSGRLQHTLAAFIEQRDSGYAVHIDPGSVQLNYEAWGLDPNNLLFMDNNGLFADNFTFSNGSQAIVMQSFGEEKDAPLDIRLFNFRISTFTRLARQDSLYLDGLVNGFFEVKLFTSHPVFFGDMLIEDLTFKKDTIGNVTVKVNNQTEDLYEIKAALSGFDNDVTLAGTYNGREDYYDATLDIERLGLSTLEPFMMGYMNRMKGHLEGGIAVTGTIDAPVVIGNMVFREAEGNIPLLNSVFSLRNERIRFLEDGMHFNAFTLTDQTGKKAILNGTALTKNWLDYRFNLDFVANDFRIINSTRRDNKLFYGQLFLDSKISFRGTTDRPDISAAFRANSKTDLTMVLPQTDPEIAEREGVVVFFDADAPESDSLFQVKIDSLNSSGLRGLNLAANLEIDPNVKLSFIIDEANGDMLVAKGKGDLSGSIDPSGKITVTGTYELEEGSYDMSVRLMKFKFDIEKGSTITWTGEPTDAAIKVTALYNVKTAPYDLVEQLINNETEEGKVKYKDRIPFRVKLKVNGELLKPDIAFDIEVAETSGSTSAVISTINTRLEQLRQDEAQMNQQVFALILLGSFVPDNPFASSSTSSGVSSLARQSVSKLLSSQLNQLAGSLITGIDIDIGIESEEEYSSGQGQGRTDLNVAFSKRLLKDRLKISVGSNFELEGNARPKEKTSNIAGDVKADYMLTRNGQYLLRAYRVDQYEVALQGQVVETGITFIINLDFNSFREFFQKKEKAGKLRK